MHTPPTPGAEGFFGLEPWPETIKIERRKLKVLLSACLHDLPSTTQTISWKATLETTADFPFQLIKLKSSIRPGPNSAMKHSGARPQSTTQFNHALLMRSFIINEYICGHAAMDQADRRPCAASLVGVCPAQREYTKKQDRKCLTCCPAEK